MSREASDHQIKVGTVRGDMVLLFEPELANSMRDSLINPVLHAEICDKEEQMRLMRTLIKGLPVARYVGDSNKATVKTVYFSELLMVAGKIVADKNDRRFELANIIYGVLSMLLPNPSSSPVLIQVPKDDSKKWQEYDELFNKVQQAKGWLAILISQGKGKEKEVEALKLKIDIWQAGLVQLEYEMGLVSSENENDDEHLLRCSKEEKRLVRDSAKRKSPDESGEAQPQPRTDSNIATQSFLAGPDVGEQSDANKKRCKKS